MPNKEVTGEHGLGVPLHEPCRIISHISEGNHCESSLAMADQRKQALFGITPLPKRGGVVTNELIDRLRDQEGI